MEQNINKNRPSESLHWYTKDGEPRYTIIGKNGKERPTTLRDARKEDYVPGVSDIKKIPLNPMLQRWIIDQNILACLTTERYENESEESYIARIKSDANEQSKKAMERGTTVHSWVQGGFEGEQLKGDPLLFFENAKAELEKECGKQDWVCELSFGTEKYGGKVDLQTEKYVIDIKTTEKDLDTVKIWDDHYMQLAAYREGMGNKGQQCGILYINILTAEAKLLWAEEEELSRGLDCFNALVDFWRAKNRVKGEGK